MRFHQVPISTDELPSQLFDFHFNWYKHMNFNHDYWTLISVDAYMTMFMFETNSNFDIYMIDGPVLINVYALQFCHSSIFINIYTWTGSIIIQYICSPNSILFHFLSTYICIVVHLEFILGIRVAIIFCYNSIFNQCMNHFWLPCIWSYFSYASLKIYKYIQG